MANLTLQVVYLGTLLQAVGTFDPVTLFIWERNKFAKSLDLWNAKQNLNNVCVIYQIYMFLRDHKQRRELETLSLGTVTYVVVVSLLQAWFHQTGDSVSWVLACDNQIASADDSPWNECFVISRTTSYVPNLVQRQLCSCMEQRGWMLTSEHWTIDCEVFSDWIWSKVWRDNIKIIVSSSCHDFSLIWSRVALWQDPSTNSVILIVSVVLIMQLAKPTNICL